MKPSSKRSTRAYVIVIPPDLSEMDDACKIWARVVRDRGPAFQATSLYRAMVLYGRDKNWTPPPPPVGMPLTDEEKHLGWRVEAAVKVLPWEFRHALLVWYLVPLTNPSTIARAMRISMRELGRRLLGALRMLETVLKRF